MHFFCHFSEQGVKLQSFTFPAFVQLREHSARHSARYSQTLKLSSLEKEVVSNTTVRTLTT